MVINVLRTLSTAYRTLYTLKSVIGCTYACTVQVYVQGVRLRLNTYDIFSKVYGNSTVISQPYRCTVLC